MNDLANLRNATEAAPGDINRWLDLVAAAEVLKSYEEVLRAGKEVMRLAPGKAAAAHIVAMALHRLDRIEEAIEAYRQVLACDPDYVDAWVNIGECWQFLNKIPEAEMAYRNAIRASGQAIANEDAREVAEEEYGNHHWNLALIELLKGDYERGFARYRAGFKAGLGKKRPDFPQPLWKGEDLQGKSILVTVEQGHGDTLMLARFLPLLHKRGAKVLWQIQPALAPLFNGWQGADEILVWGRDPLPHFDYHASEFDLPHRLGTTIGAIPAKPYLPQLPVAEEVMLPDDGKLKVGVVWGGNPNHPNDKRRSVPLLDFAAVFAAKNAYFYNLNRDMRPGDTEVLAKYPVADLAPRITDFAATARIIGQLDLVITCDTSTAHLAGGMGKPVWILLPYAPVWCWMLEREDCLWYPTARLFRQKNRGDWGDVMQRMKAALEKI